MTTPVSHDEYLEHLVAVEDGRAVESLAALTKLHGERAMNDIIAFIEAS